MIQGIIFSIGAIFFISAFSAISQLVKKTKKIWIVMFLLFLFTLALSYVSINGYAKVFDLDFSGFIQSFLLFIGALFGYGNSKIRHLVLELTYTSKKDDVNPDEVL